MFFVVPTNCPSSSIANWTRIILPPRVTRILDFRKCLVPSIVVRIVWSSGWRKFWKELLLVTDVSTTWAEVIFRVKWIVFVRRWWPISFNELDIEHHRLDRETDSNRLFYQGVANNYKKTYIRNPRQQGKVAKQRILWALQWLCTCVMILGIFLCPSLQNNNVK